MSDITPILKAYMDEIESGGVNPTTKANRCPCCGRDREYDFPTGRFWYLRRPRWFWRIATKIVCSVRGRRKNCDYGDCFRCG